MDIREEKLEELLFKLRRYRWLHRRASKHYQPLNITLLTISFLISSIAGSLAIVGNDSDDKNVKKIISYSIAVASIMNGFLSIINNNLKYGNKVSNNKLAAQAYDRLITVVNFEKEFPTQGIKIKDFVAKIEDEIIKIKQDLKVLTEERFENELNKLLDNGLDISSDAGYKKKISFINTKMKPTRINVQPREDDNTDYNTEETNLDTLIMKPFGIQRMVNDMNNVRLNIDSQA